MFQRSVTSCKNPKLQVKTFSPSFTLYEIYVHVRMCLMLQPGLNANWISLFHFVHLKGVNIGGGKGYTSITRQSLFSSYHKSCEMFRKEDSTCSFVVLQSGCRCVLPVRSQGSSCRPDKWDPPSHKGRGPYHPPMMYVQSGYSQIWMGIKSNWFFMK